MIKRPSIFEPDIIPINIRENTTIYIQGIPFDLTEAEAKKIASIVNAFVPPKSEK